MISKYNDIVLKSHSIDDGVEAPENNRFLTTVHGMHNDEGYDVCGEGVIDVKGPDASIYNTSGILVGKSSRLHYLNLGIYVTDYNGRAVKVVVKYPVPPEPWTHSSSINKWSDSTPAAPSPFLYSQATRLSEMYQFKNLGLFHTFFCCYLSIHYLCGCNLSILNVYHYKYIKAIRSITDRNGD